MKKLALPALLVAVAAAILGVRSLRKDEASQFRLVQVARGDVRAVVSSTGTLQATRTVQVGTQVSGQIARLFADYNDRVKANQLIARIDPTLLEQAVRSAEADLARSRAELERAQQSLDRIEGLFVQAAATEEARDAAKSARDVARAAVMSAEVNVERARQNLSYTEIRSPIDGVVLDRTVDVGQTVAASLSAPQLFLIAGDLQEMEILASVDESDIGRIVDGQKVEFTVQAYADEKFEGTVRQVRLQSTTLENVVNYTVAVAVRNEDGRLLPGMTATVDFLVAEAADVLTVANAALRFRPTAAMRAGSSEGRRGRDGAAGGRADTSAGGAGRGAEVPADRGVLWIVDAGGKPTALPVRVGLTDGQVTEVSGPGIEEGLEVIAGVVSGATSSAANPFQSGGPPRFGPPGP
jgi:HlyD family secretion protein